LDVIDELGIDLSSARPQKLAAELAAHADVIVTMGCGDQCPYFPGKRYIDWDLPDPKGQPIAQVRAIRDDIANRVHQLVAELDSVHTPATIQKS
jgi:arsenate reductase